MKAIGMVVGVVGLLALIINFWLAILLLIIGALMVASGASRERALREERRHQEIMSTREKNK